MLYAAYWYRNQSRSTIPWRDRRCYLTRLVPWQLRDRRSRDFVKEQYEVRFFALWVVNFDVIARGTVPRYREAVETFREIQHNTTISKDWFSLQPRSQKIEVSARRDFGNGPSRLGRSEFAQPAF